MNGNHGARFLGAQGHPLHGRKPAGGFEGFFPGFFRDFNGSDGFGRLRKIGKLLHARLDLAVILVKAEGPDHQSEPRQH
jgi:hypothetical protein